MSIQRSRYDKAVDKCRRALLQFERLEHQCFLARRAYERERDHVVACRRAMEMANERLRERNAPYTKPLEDDADDD